jgi:hypothetical protein
MALDLILPYHSRTAHIYEPRRRRKQARSTDSGCKSPFSSVACDGLTKATEGDEPQARDDFAYTTILIFDAEVIANEAEARVGRIALGVQLRIAGQVTDGAKCKAVHVHLLSRRDCLAFHSAPRAQGVRSEAALGGRASCATLDAEHGVLFSIDGSPKKLHVLNETVSRIQEHEKHLVFQSSQLGDRELPDQIRRCHRHAAADASTHHIRARP